MKKGTRYLLAIVACFAIFVLYVICQMVIAKGMLVTVLFMGAMAAAWKAIVGNKREKVLMKKVMNRNQGEMIVLLFSEGLMYICINFIRRQSFINLLLT